MLLCTWRFQKLAITIIQYFSLQIIQNNRLKRKKIILFTQDLHLICP